MGPGLSPSLANPPSKGKNGSLSRPGQEIRNRETGAKPQPQWWAASLRRVEPMVPSQGLKQLWVGKEASWLWPERLRQSP